MEIYPEVVTAYFLQYLTHHSVLLIPSLLTCQIAALLVNVFSVFGADRQVCIGRPVGTKDNMNLYLYWTDNLIVKISINRILKLTFSFATTFLVV